MIDIHAHTSNHKMIGLHTEDATLPTLKRIAQEHGVERVCLMATYFPFKQSGVHNRVLLDRIAGDQFFRMFGSLDMTGNLPAGCLELESLLKERLIAGIKLYPGYQAFSLASTGAFSIYTIAENYGIPVMIHGGSLHECCRRDEKLTYRCGHMTCPLDGLQYLSMPKQLRPALRMYPGVNFIMSHLAYPYTDELRAVMQEYPNLYTDIGAIIRTGDVDDDTEEERQRMADEVVRIVEEVPNGIQRVMFATDFPIQGYATSVDLLKRMHLSPEDEIKVAKRNAENLGL